MENLIIENPTKLTDTSFKITINGKDFEYEISDDKNIDSVIEKLNTWIDRGEDSFGGLYDYIKNTFKLVGEYEEPVEDLEDDIDLDAEKKAGNNLSASWRIIPLTDEYDNIESYSYKEADGQKQEIVKLSDNIYISNENTKIDEQSKSR